MRHAMEVPAVGDRAVPPAERSRPAGGLAGAHPLNRLIQACYGSVGADARPIAAIPSRPVRPACETCSKPAVSRHSNIGDGTLISGLYGFVKFTAGGSSNL